MEKLIDEKSTSIWQKALLQLHSLLRTTNPYLTRDALFNGLKERPQSEAFNRILFDIFVLNID